MGSKPLVDLTGSFTRRMHDVLAEAARRGPLATDETTGATVVLRHRDVETLARDERLNGIGLALFDTMGISDGPLRDWYSKLMFTTEGDYHRRLRSLVSRAFTPRSVEELRSTAADMAAAAIASAMLNGGDLVASCAGLSTRLICRLLGVPDSDVGVFSRWADALSPVFYVMTPGQIAGATSAIVELQHYVEALAQRRTEDPGPDLITGLLTAEAGGEMLTRDETVAMIANLLVAGHDTMGSQIPCSLLMTLQYRDRLTEVAHDDTRLASAAAETMRLEPSIPLIPRTAVAPIDLHDTTIPAGEMVLLCIASACRDASAWRSPNCFDPERFTRAGTPRLMNFGAGAHYCLGTSLAKVVVEECVRAALAARPALHLGQDPARIPWRRMLGRSPVRLLIGVDES
ncbi:cytochrome P450 [Mycobacterium sp. E3251]|uniref:cytochrome P450 n=1 Tax=Mycobacterium sp. E3251 TaxID=1834144 RepID=UPI000A3E5BEE|nr:cytochrome P450 [Mycobacterium sp. E3251]